MMRRNDLAAAEMGEEENYNQIDGVISNTPPRASVRDALRRHWEEEANRRKEEAERQREAGPERTPRGEER